MHLVVRTPPNVSVSELMGVLNGAERQSGCSIRFRIFVRRSRGRSLLVAGLVCGFVGANEEIILRYVRHQDKVSRENEESQLTLNAENN